MSSRVDRKVLKYFKHVDRMTEEQMTYRVDDSVVEGKTSRGWHILRLVNGVKKACKARTQELRVAKVKCVVETQRREPVNGTNSVLNVKRINKYTSGAKQ